MPLIRSKSKKAFEENMKAEMQAGKPQNQALAIAYDMKRRAGKRKMAEGGDVKSSEIQAVRNKEALRRISDKGGKGVHPESYSREESHSDVGNHLKQINSKMAPKHKEKIIAQAKEEHKRVLSELKAMPKPKLAEGGMIKSKMQPRMAESSIIKPRLRSDIDQEAMRQHEEHMMRSMQPEDHEQTSDAQEEQIEHDIQDDQAEMLARGGEVEMIDEQPMEEEQEEHHNSIAAAIMSRRKRMAEGGLMHEGDEMLKEGEVDLDDNGREIPNQFYHQNEDEALEQNLDHDIMDMDQPMDSNEHGDDIDSDKHDMISQIRSKMNRQRQFKVK